MSSNPKLAALFQDFLSDEDEDNGSEEFENVKVNDEEEPLFISNTQGNKKEDLLNDMNAYVDEEAIDQVISRIYENEALQENYLIQTQKEIEDADEEDAIFNLNSDDFYQLWLSRVPDAFMYLYSFNDEYKKTLRRSIEEHNPDTISKKLASLRKQYSKTNESDELTLEALSFEILFLESVVKWKKNHPFIDSQLASMEESDEGFESVSEEPPATVQQMNKDEQLIIESDEDEKDIEFVEATTASANLNNDTFVVSDEEEDDDIQWVSSQKSENTGDSAEPQPSKAEHVHINIQQSSLHTADDGKHVNTTKNNLDTDVKNNQHTLSREDLSVALDAKNNTDKMVEDRETSTDNTEHSAKVIDKKSAHETSTIKEDSVHEDQIMDNDIDHIKNNDDDANREGDMNPRIREDHGYNSEDEFEGNAKGEDDEFARFVSDIASKNIEDIRTELHSDMRDLNRQQRKDMGNSDDITDQMIQDIQELLKLFGIPYIVSPMEAEAQCAELEILSLVDGTITDDSDVFLFGASKVYKNMFNQQRYVECYQTQDIEREMLLSRKKLIQLAFLLGSDYTEGIAGVGPVAAMEILAEFSSNEEDEDLRLPLQRFKEWYDSGKDETPFQKKFVCCNK